MKKHLGIALLALCLSLSSVWAGSAVQWDPKHYIRVDEIRTDMPAYCLTVLEGEKVEKFDLKILSIIRNAEPGKHRILVVGLDERFKHVGSVHGCSGSPVFIDGRMAGALSAGWDGAIDPLYLITPIEDMLAIDMNADKKSASQPSSVSYIDLSSPINLHGIAQKADVALQTGSDSNARLPLMTNLSSKACQALSGNFGSMGLMPVQAGDIVGVSTTTTIEPGGVLAVPLCTGDLRMMVVGTATEVIGDQVYGFGHPFVGLGATELPIAAGLVHTVVATRDTAFKLASAGPVIGTLFRDQDSGILGQIGPTPTMIDLEITVNRFDAPQERIFTCKIAKDRQLTPRILRSAVIGAVLNQGDLPPEHYIQYQCDMTLENDYVFHFGGLSSEQSIQEPVMNIFALSMVLMNNAFQAMPPKKVSLTVDIHPENRIADLWEARISKSVVRPGETVQFNVAVKTFRNEPQEIQVDLPIPADCPEGKYKVQICGVDAYQGFLTQVAPQRFMATDAKSLLSGLTRVLAIPSDRLYVCMPLKVSGISIRDTELPDLPASKTALLTEGKRLMQTTPYQKFIENSVQTDLLINGAAAIELTISKNP